MKLKIFSAAAVFLIACLFMAVGGYAQHSVACRGEVKTSTKGLSTAKTKAFTGSGSTAKTPVCTSAGSGIKPAPPAKASVRSALRLIETEPLAMLTPMIPGVTMTAAEADVLSDQDAARAKQRIIIRQGKALNIREGARRIEPDSPMNVEVIGLPAVAYGFRELDPDEERMPDVQENKNTIQQKDYSKTYSVDADDKLVINNSFGDVTVHTWNRNEFKVDVHIKVTANEGDVLISDTRTNSMVSFTTKITQNGRSPFTTKRTVNNIIVNYTVYMPAKNPLEVSNRFGNITLPDMDGRVVINCEHGALVAKRLSSKGNMINVSNGNANIESLKESDLNAENGSLVVITAEKLNANISNSSAKIGRIIYSGNINAKYGAGLLIGDVSKNLQNLTINSKYTNVKLGVNNSQNANFDVTIRYGNFTYDKNANIYVAQKDTNDNSDKWSATQNYKGYVGKGNVNKLIFINSSYSTVSLTD